MVVAWLSIAVIGAAAGQSAPPAASEDEKPPSEEIVVTGERVERSLQETASSVYVAKQSDIEARPIDRVEQLLASVPNVLIGHGSQGPAIRGQDTTGALQALPAFLGGNRPRTTLIVDGRPVTYNEFVFGAEPVWDVERIEVFRSPQTTTQGQNSIAGAIFVYTNEPAFEREYRARAIGGDFRTRQVSAVASGPVNGDVAMRLAGDFRYSRTTSRIADRAEGADPNHDVYGLARAKVLVTPQALPGTRLSLTYSHLQSQAPQLVGVTAPFRKRRDEDGFYGTFRINVDSLTATARHESGDLTANVLVTAGDSVARRLAFPGFGQTRIDGRDWSAEGVVNWTPSGPLHVTGGVSRRHLELGQFIDLSLPALGTGRFRDRQEGAGVFGEASFEFAPLATVTAGIRYQHDRQARSGVLGTETSAIDLAYDRTFQAWLPKLSLAYDFTPQFSAGVLVQRAYNPGGTTLRFDTGQPDNFEAETLWDYELFGRAIMADGRLTASANLFYYDMHNAQRARDILLPGPGGFDVGFSDLFNVPRAHSSGFEGSIEWRANRRLTAALGIGLLRTKVVRTGPDDVEFEGRQFDRAPHFTASASADWRPKERLNLSAQVRHHSGYFSDPLNMRDGRVPAATIADARAEYRFDRFAVSAYVRNLFDTFSPTWRDRSSATLEDPRQVGIGIEGRF